MTAHPKAAPRVEHNEPLFDALAARRKSSQQHRRRHQRQQAAVPGQDPAAAEKPGDSASETARRPGPLEFARQSAVGGRAGGRASGQLDGRVGGQVACGQEIRSAVVSGRAGTVDSVVGSMDDLASQSATSLRSHIAAAS